METSSRPSCGFSHNPLHKLPSWLNDVIPPLVMPQSILSFLQVRHLSLYGRFPVFSAKTALLSSL